MRGGELLAQLRRRAGFTQQGLADAVQCSRSAVYQIEVGTRHPSSTLVDGLATVLRLCEEERLQLFLSFSLLPEQFDSLHLGLVLLKAEQSRLSEPLREEILNLLAKM